MIFILIIFLVSFNVLATSVEDIASNRAQFIGAKIEIDGIISDIKYDSSKDGKHLKFKLTSKFAKEYIKVDYYFSQYGKEINKYVECHVGQKVKLTGPFYAKEKGDYLGEIKINEKVNLLCKDDDEYKKLEKSYQLNQLENIKENLSKSLIQVSGYIKNKKSNVSTRKETLTFTLVDSSKKLKLNVKVLLSFGDYTVNHFSCAEGQSVKITGPFIANKYKGHLLGTINIISKENIECLEQKMELTEKELKQIQKNQLSKNLQQLKVDFVKYKNLVSQIYDKKIADEITILLKEMAAICKLPEGSSKLIFECNKISYFVRTIEQRNQISFKIDSSSKNMAYWQKLNSYLVGRNNKVLEIIKSLYPVNSDYIIGIPLRCYPDQQFNPSASNFPYKELNVSKYARENFTAILNKFNDPALKCGSLLDSIYFIGNMDNDSDLEVLKIDMSSSKLIKIIHSDVK